MSDDDDRRLLEDVQQAMRRCYNGEATDDDWKLVGWWLGQHPADITQPETGRKQ